METRQVSSTVITVLHLRNRSNMMQTTQETLTTAQNEVYGAYTSPYQPVSSASVGVLEATDAPTEQGIVEPSGSPPEPPTLPPISPPSRPRPAPAGDIVTNNHVVSGEQSITVVLSNGSTEQGQLIGTSASNDLAVVRITPYAHMVVAQFGDSSKLVVGQDVIAVGNPLGITGTATEGIVSALNRSIPESAGVTISNAIQTDAALNPGNSGGALINVQGQLIGIPFAGAQNSGTNTTADGVNFAIPSNLVQTVVQQMLQQGTP